ncbi:MAG TPA: glycoside hydrolase [Cyanobacteria bacterium UBA11162]|nr:glycoside hydrolase [Cyanobacteria bacterium UBA11162]
MSRFFLHPIAHLTHITSAFLVRVFHHFRQWLFHQDISWKRSFYRYSTTPSQKQNCYRSQPANKHVKSTGSIWQYAIRRKPFNFEFFIRGICFGLAFLFSLAIGLGWFAPKRVDATNSAITIQLPLSTRGSKIVDAKGQTVLLRGVNWFGIETEMHVPHGLWKRDYKEMLSQIKALGYNTIRLPYSVESLRSSELSGIDYTLGANAELQGKSPLEVMDAVISEADRQGLMILLDSHRLNDEQIPELWYGDGFTEEDWIDTWTMLAERYKNQINIIGADLKNEPHGRASWGTNDPATDWRLAAERAGNAILKINPNWLIVVEGVENNVPGQKLEIHWMGANLEGVDRFPVRLSVSNKVVYSPHEYGAGVFDQPWFSESSFPNNLYKRWEIGWNYIATKGIAPVFIGEFGGRQIDTLSKEGIWQQKLIEFVRQKDLSFAYWSWNPNSDDTGGVLLDDWLTVDAPKQELLQGLLIATRFAHSPTASSINSKPIAINPTLKPQPGLIDSTPSQPQLKVVSDIRSDWQDGFCVSLEVTNVDETTVQDWQVQFQMNQAAINQSWNGNFKGQGSQYSVTPLDWGRAIEPGQSRDFGFCANKLGADYKPRQISARAISSTSNSQRSLIVPTRD